MKSSFHPEARGSRLRSIIFTAGILLLLTCAAVAIHGYHYAAEDASIYIPAIKQHLNPALYARDSEFFTPQTAPTLIDDLVAASIRLTHVSVPAAVFAWHVASIFVFLLSCWGVSLRCFGTRRAALGSVGLITALLTLPVTGTALYIVDQYLHPRTLATGLILLGLAAIMPNPREEEDAAAATPQMIVALLCLMAAALLHIQMAFFGFLLLAVFALRLERVAAIAWRGVRQQTAGFSAMAVTVLGTLFQPGSPEWREAARTKASLYLVRWEWYEWLGILGPIVLLWVLARLRNQLPGARRVALRTCYFAAISFVGAALLTIPPRFERLTPYQPMRTFHLVYTLMILLIGGLLAERVLGEKLWRWVVVLLPLVAVMFFVQRDLFAGSRHIEWPGKSTGNAWVDAFDWVRVNTPADAYFALGPHFMKAQGEDFHGFRAIAERSQMADIDKDSGVVVLFPAVGKRWHNEVHALSGWEHFGPPEFAKLRSDFGVDWVIVERRYEQNRFLTCPYENSSVAVCRLQ